MQVQNLKTVFSHIWGVFPLIYSLRLHTHRRMLVDLALHSLNRLLLLLHIVLELCLILR